MLPGFFLTMLLWLSGKVWFHNRLIADDLTNGVFGCTVSKKWQGAVILDLANTYQKLLKVFQSFSRISDLINRNALSGSYALSNLRSPRISLLNS